MPEELLREHGAVSAEVAAAMAAGAGSLAADVGVSVTGVAGPGGGSDEARGPRLHRRQRSEERAHDRVQLPADRQAIRSRAAVAALHLVRRQLTQS